MILDSNVVLATDDIEVIGDYRLMGLQLLAAQHPKLRARLLLHQAHDSPVQEMIIVAHRDSYVRAHRHPIDRSESYHLMHGELDVRIYSDAGRLERAFRLTKECPFYRVRGGWYHEPKPVSEWVTYHEVFTGPFDKERDVQYAPWAESEAA